MLYAFRAFLLAGFTALAVSKAIVRPQAFTDTSQSFGNTSTSRIAVPFGTLGNVKFSEPSLVQTAESDFDINVVANDQAWEKYRAKGFWYGCLLDMTVERAGKAMGDTRLPPSAESIWQGDFQNDVRNWGWQEALLESDSNCDFRDELDVKFNNKIGTALIALGLSLLPLDTGGDNECYSIEHGDEDLEDEDGEGTYEINGLELPFTGAHYRFAMNKRGGAIFAQDLLSPKSAAEKHIQENFPQDQLPRLSRLSDIMWSYWFRHNPDPRNLDHYFVNNVKNDETLPLISRVLKNHQITKVPYWPGLQLEMDSAEAQAILGSPMGSTIAHFLIQHKATLGIKNFESITIFRDNFPENQPAAQIPEVQLLFSILDVPTDEVIDDDIEMPDAGTAKSKRTVRPQGGSGRNIVREHRVVAGLDAD